MLSLIISLLFATTFAVAENNSKSFFSETWQNYANAKLVNDIKSSGCQFDKNGLNGFTHGASQAVTAKHYIFSTKPLKVPEQVACSAFSDNPNADLSIQNFSNLLNSHKEHQKEIRKEINDTKNKVLGPVLSAVISDAEENDSLPLPLRAQISSKEEPMYSFLTAIENMNLEAILNSTQGSKKEFNEKNRINKSISYECCLAGFISGLSYLEQSIAKLKDHGDKENFPICRQELQTGVQVGIKACHNECVTFDSMGKPNSIEKPKYIGCFNLGLMKGLQNCDNNFAQICELISQNRNKNEILGDDSVTTPTSAMPASTNKR